MTFRYIGSKARLVEEIKAHIGLHNAGFFVDAFCGTGAVAEAAAELGWPVRINDHLASATIATAARLASVSEAHFGTLGGYQAAVAALNAARPIHGFIWKEYSPASKAKVGVERRYFTEVNASKIDAMRTLIREWSSAGIIDEIEERLLIADLLSALNRVANIAGTFGCFLSKWTPQSAESIEVRPRKLKTKKAILEVSIGDVFNVKVESADVVYLDPPYTKRQYASYYHILETVVLGDTPVVEGVCGLRPWKDRASDFCYKARALNTLSKLIGGMPAERILLSYSSEGHVGINDLEIELKKIGQAHNNPLSNIGRYRPNQTASDAGSKVKEYLIVVQRYLAETMEEGALA